MKCINVGIDVSKNKLDICLLGDNLEEYLTIINRKSSIKDFIDFLLEDHPNSSIYVGYEATSTYMIPLQEVLKEYPNIKSKMINPYYLHHFFKFQGIKEKTDKSDAYGIALFISKQPDEFFSEEKRHYRNIFQPYITALEHLKKHRVQLKNLMHSQKGLLDDDLKEQIRDIERKIKELEYEIEKRAKEKMRQEIPEYEDIQKKIEGVGFITLLYVLPYIADSYKTKSFKHFQSFFGLNPIRYESGISVKKNPKISKRGNANVRKILYMSTLSSLRCNKIIQEKFNRLINQGKKKKVALIACSAHLLRAIYKTFVHLKSPEICLKVT